MPFGHSILIYSGCGDTSCSSGKVAGLLFYAVFSFLWTSQVIGNVSLATLAGGPYGCKRHAYQRPIKHIFLCRLVLLWTAIHRGHGAHKRVIGSRLAISDNTPQPKRPTLNSFFRASTFSLGSIAFGSLIVTILEVVRLMLNAARNNANQQGNGESLWGVAVSW